MPRNTLVTILAAGLAGFALVGVAGWLIRRFWRSPAGAAFVPASLWALVQTKAAAADPRQMDFALVSVFMGVVWWQLFDRADARRDARRRREEEARRERAAQR